MNHRKRLGLTAVLAVTALLTGACGSGEATSSGGNSLLDEAAAKLTGEPIVIADISELSGVPGFAPSAMPNGAKAAAAYINDNGGIGGRPIKITSCDSKFDPGASAACAQQAVAQKSLAVIGIDDFSSTGGDALFEKNNIITMNSPNQPTLIQSPNSFAIGPGGVGEFYGLGHYLGTTAKLKNISLLMQDQPVGRTYAQQLEKAAKEAGVETVNTVFFNPQITDFSASVAKVTSTDPEAVFTLVNGSQIPQVWGQLQQQGIKPEQIYIHSVAMDAEVFDAAGPAAVGANVISEFTNPDDLNDPDVKIFREAMDKYGFGDIARSALAEWGFANVMFLADAAKTIGADKVNAATLKEYLTTTLAPGSTTTIPTFLGSPAAAAPPEFPGIHRPGISILRWDGTKFVTVEGFFTPPQLQPAQP
ncbi:MAG: ABC transporter substrate-binding protein [Hyphomicrobiales bacterium]|nr:MAG: ABC transporter substrate-binding protein [Hyphomicrobiales bacterium]